MEHSGTPEKPRTPPRQKKKPEHPPKKPEHLPKYQERKYVTVKKIMRT